MDLNYKVTLAYFFCACFCRELCDIGDIGKLNRDQFALALYLINQKLSKGIDPPQTLSLEMIPPSDRLARQVYCLLNLRCRSLLLLFWVWNNVIVLSYQFLNPLRFYFFSNLRLSFFCFFYALRCKSLGSNKFLMISKAAFIYKKNSNKY